MDVQTTNSQESASEGKYMEKYMSSVLYAIAGTIIVLCILIHGCLFYRRWRLKRVRASVTSSPDRGWSWSKVHGKATVNKDSIMSAKDIESGDPTELVSTGIHLAKSSPSSSLLDQDLNERRMSSTRIKVLPAVSLSRSSSASAHSLQQKAENGPDEGDNEDELSSNLSKNLKVDAVEKGEPSKGTSDVTPSPDNEPCSEYELIQCGTVETPNEKDTKTDTTCKLNTVPTILQTQPSDEHSECDLFLAGASGVSTRTNVINHPKDLFKRRSFSFDNVPVLGAGGYTELQQTNSAALTQGRGRSASESQGRSPKTPKTMVSFDDKTVSGTSEPDPTYFTLIPDSELEPKHDKRYRTLPPIKSNVTTTETVESSSFVKRKLGLSSFKFSRKNKKSDKKKNKTPPSSPARNANPGTSSAIYEEPEFFEEPNPATCPVYFTLEQPNEEKSVIGKCEESIMSTDSKTGTKASIFKNSPKIRIKSKGSRNIITHKKNPEPKKFQNDEDAPYEDLEAPTESTKVDEAPVYDTLEPGPLAPPVPPNNNSGPVIGRTTTGAPLRQFKPARRELPKRPSPNVYDCIERGAFPSPGSKQRSQTLLPATRRGSSPSSQRFNKTPSTTYDSLCPSTLPEHIKAASVRRGSSPETTRSQPDADAVYDLLNPDTFTQQTSDGSAKQLAPRPGVSPKPKSLRLQRNTSLTYDTLHQEFQIRRGSLGTRPPINTRPKPLLRTNSLSKIQKERPDISPKPLPQGQNSVDTKPAVPKKPIINGNTSQHKNDLSKNCDGPVYFTLDPHASPEPV